MNENSKLAHMLLRFWEAMSDKLHRKADEGRRGWDEGPMRDELVKRLREHVERDEWLDVANYAAMLWWRRHGPRPPSPGDGGEA